MAKTKTHQLSKAGSLVLDKKWLEAELKVTSEDEVMQLRIPDYNAVVLTKLAPLSPMPDRIIQSVKTDDELAQEFEELKKQIIAEYLVEQEGAASSLPAVESNNLAPAASEG